MVLYPADLTKISDEKTFALGRLSEQFSEMKQELALRNADIDGLVDSLTELATALKYRLPDRAEKVLARRLSNGYVAKKALELLVATELRNGLRSTEPDHHLLPAALFRHTKAGDGMKGSGFDPTKPMQSWRTAWRKLTVAAGLPGLRFHDLRHHCITRLAEAGVPDQTLMSIAGHVSRQMLDHYSHIRMQAKREAVAGLEAKPQIEQPIEKLEPVKIIV